MGLNAGKVRFEVLREIAFGAILNTYVAVGTPFENPVRLLKATNLTDADLKISFNGTDDEDVISANGAWIYDYCSDRSSRGGGLQQPAHTQMYVKYVGAAPTSKSFYVTVIYASVS